MPAWTKGGASFFKRTHTSCICFALLWTSFWIWETSPTQFFRNRSFALTKAFMHWCLIIGQSDEVMNVSPEISVAVMSTKRPSAMWRLSFRIFNEWKNPLRSFIDIDIKIQSFNNPLIAFCLYRRRSPLSPLSARSVQRERHAILCSWDHPGPRAYAQSIRRLQRSQGKVVTVRRSYNPLHSSLEKGLFVLSVTGKTTRTSSSGPLLPLKRENKMFRSSLCIL